MRNAVNEASIQEITDHLYRMDNKFDPPLSSYTNIEEYAHKLGTLAVNVEFYDENNRLVGLLSSYYDPVKKRVHFSNFSLEDQKYGNGLAWLKHLLYFHKWRKFGEEKFKDQIPAEIFDLLENDYLKAQEKRNQGGEFTYDPAEVYIQVQNNNERLIRYYQQMGFIVAERGEKSSSLKLIV